ncbi:MAG: late competence development ComFB family protein [Cyanobacteria bacterium P01_A01_bin.17]
MSFYQAQIYKNVMEALVAEEIKNQLNQNPAYRSQKINITEVATYALNRVPPLYASSQEGLYRQKQRAQKEFGQHLKAAVHKGLEIVTSKPLRLTTPLLPEEDLEAEAQLARMALERLPMEGELF